MPAFSRTERTVILTTTTTFLCWYFHPFLPSALPLLSPFLTRSRPRPAGKASSWRTRLLSTILNWTSPGDVSYRNSALTTVLWTTLSSFTDWLHCLHLSLALQDPHMSEIPLRSTTSPLQGRCNLAYNTLNKARSRRTSSSTKWPTCWALARHVYVPFPSMFPFSIKSTPHSPFPPHHASPST